MIAEGLWGALGDGWLGKLIVGAVCGVGAWYARRPVEKAAITDAVTRRVESLFSHLETEVSRLATRCKGLEEALQNERERCDIELDQMRAQIAALMSEPIPGYTNPRPTRRKPS